MIFTIFYLFLATALGWAILANVFKSFWERIIFGGTIGITLLVAINFLLALLLPLPLATFGSIFGALVIILWGIKEKKWKLERDILYTNFIVFTVLLWGVLFGYLLWQTHLSKDGNLFMASPSTYGDLPFHLTLVTNFAYGKNFPPVNPLAPFTHLSYHFFVDFLSGILLNITDNLFLSFIIPGTVLGIFTASSLSLLTYQVGKSTLAAVLAPFIFFFNGGIGFLKFFEVVANQGFFAAIFSVHNRYAHIPEWGVDYPNILAEILMAERALLLGLPLTILALFLLIIWNEKKQARYLIFAGITTGFLPYANIYGFISVALVSILLFLFHLSQSINKKSVLRSYILHGFVILLLVTPFALWIAPQITSRESFVKIAVMQWPPLADNTQKLFFWLTNFGLIPLLSLFALIKVTSIKSSARIVLGLLLLITPLTHLVLFQPYPWDNNRFVLFPFVSMAILTSILLAQLIKSSKVINKLIGVFLLIVSIFQGALVTIHDPQILYPLYSQKDFDFAKLVRTNTKPADIILTSRTHNHPVPTLAGRRILLGSRGYLDTQGISDPLEKTDAMKTIFLGQDQDSSLVKLYGINYILIGPWEKAEFNIDEESLLKRYQKIYDNDTIKILKTGI